MSIFRKVCLGSCVEAPGLMNVSTGVLQASTDMHDTLIDPRVCVFVAMAIRHPVTPDTTRHKVFVFGFVDIHWH